MMSYQRNLLPLISFLLILATMSELQTVVYCQTANTYCLNNGNYTNNSAYQTNLHTLLSNLSSNMDANGFYNGSLGESPDTVNAMVICRGDTQLDTCRSCVGNATVAVLQSCPNYRQSISWLDLCWLRYSNATMYEIIDYTNMFMEWNTQNVTGPVTEFMSDLGILMYDLRLRATSGGSLRKVAFGNRSTSDFQTIYGMLQCTPDLSQQECNSCLTTAAQQLPRCCDSKVYARVYVPSCDLRYATRLIYNETRLQELQSMSMPPVPSPTPPVPSQPAADGVKALPKTQTMIIVVVSVIGGLIVIFIAGFLIRKRTLSQASEKETDNEAEDHVSTNVPRTRVMMTNNNNERGRGPRLHDVYGGVPLPGTQNAEHLQLKFGEIKVATNDFSKSNVLGRGGFGNVYWGKLVDGREIAVKRLSIDSDQGDPEFKNEVVLLSKLKHTNLVNLIGFSSEGTEKLLVYEYVRNASLEKFLFDATKRSMLDWDIRYKIIRGIVKGIVYLHDDCGSRIVHRDLKPSNILLDEKMDSKIADFGLAKLIELDVTHASTNKGAGTPGYMAPELKVTQQFSFKTDMYSFGVLLLEIISGQKKNDPGETQQNLISRVWDNWRNGTAANVIDGMLRDGSSSRQVDKILRCIHIGLLCVQGNVAKRSTIADVVRMLDGVPVNLPEPLQPGFYDPPYEDDSIYHSLKSSTQENGT